MDVHDGPAGRGVERQGGAPRIQSVEHAKSSVEEAIATADPTMFFQHIGSAGMSPEATLEALAKLSETFGRKLRSSMGYELGNEKLDGLENVAAILRGKTGA